MNPLRRLFKRTPSSSRSREPEFKVSFGPALLYLDDVQDICDKLGDFLQQWSVRDSGKTGRERGLISIKAGDLEVDSVGRLRYVSRSQLKKLTLTAYSPVTIIHLQPQLSGIAILSDDPKALRFASSIKEFIRARRSWRALLHFGSLLEFSGLFFFLAVLILGLIITSNGNESVPWTISTLIVLTVAITAIAPLSRLRRTVRVIPQLKQEARPSWPQDRTRLLWVVATILLGLAAVETIAITIFAGTQRQKLWSPVVFQDIASIGTFAAAAAAWFSALVVQRQKSAKESRKAESGSTKETSDDLMRTVIDRMSDGSLTESQVRQIERLLALRQTEAVPSEVKAALERRLDRLPDLERVREFNHSGESPMAAYYLGTLLQEQGDVRGALAAFQRAIDSDHPRAAPMALMKLGVLLQEQGDVRGARNAFQLAIDSGLPDVTDEATQRLQRLKRARPR